jgi:transcriptional regulator with XRE-family HTH domain
MTPFGARLRELRRERGIQLKHMAKGLGVSAAYLSALEHGHRGRPNRAFVHRICAYLNIIWDEAEELQALAQLSHPRVSHPRVAVDTSGLSPEATELANRLAERIEKLDPETVRKMLALLDRKAGDGA